MIGLALLLALWMAIDVPPPWASRSRYGDTEGHSLRGMLERSDVAVHAEVVSGDGGPLSLFGATYRVITPIKGAVAAGDLLRLSGAGRLPYLGRISLTLFGDGRILARAGTDVLLFLRREVGSAALRPVASSGVLAIDQLCYWDLEPPEGLAAAFVPALVELAAIQRGQPDGAGRRQREIEWLLAGLSRPLLAERAAADLVLNWRGRPPLDCERAWTCDASDLRAEMSADQELQLVEVLADRHLSCRARGDVAWALADTPDPRLDGLLLAELRDALAAEAAEPAPPWPEPWLPRSLFPGEYFYDSAIVWMRPLMAVLAHRFQDPLLRAAADRYEQERWRDGGEWVRWFLVAAGS